eukprot:CAMPEP_0176392798 /NCGR_PEP_ID=MMETSP0126-20121128/41167_1 /TAXON_ID=141414 ORGANISM="Strombidinopsis acuminatum, Strain SPMC142" /NCGR_SAMPLE_ID=MMETSP0126 /ASSEMBLY_ACC=CAM_ASM_000229 /LENGTH=70 /DNA_ID=CAMNT_0017763833 /DNA_START=1396 /DNA_END=1608 /DNA_ORIENTATION=-
MHQVLVSILYKQFKKNEEKGAAGSGCLKLKFIQRCLESKHKKDSTKDSSNSKDAKNIESNRSKDDAKKDD